MEARPGGDVLPACRPVGADLSEECSLRGAAGWVGVQQSQGNGIPLWPPGGRPGVWRCPRHSDHRLGPKIRFGG
jgi:hypothetical protein